MVWETRIRGVLAIGFLLCSFTVSTAVAGRCERILNTIGKTVSYPIAGPMDYYLSRSDNPAESWGKTLKRRLVWDSPFIALHVALMALNDALDPTYLSDEFHNEIAAYGDKTPEGLQLYINIFDPIEDREHFLANEEQFRRLKKIRPKLIYRKAESMGNALAIAQDLAKSEGKPVALLLLNDHGNAGYFSYWNQSDIERRVFDYRPRSGNSRFVEISDSLFAKGARVEFHSCSVAQGQKGEAFIKKFGETYLKNGGVLYASKIVTNDSIMKENDLAINKYLVNPFLKYVAPSGDLGVNIFLQRKNVRPDATLSERLNLKKHRLFRLVIDPKGKK